jgi:hypothetical protein
MSDEQAMAPEALVVPADAIEAAAGNSRFFVALRRYVESERYDDEHPDDAHGGDELDYCRDLIAEAALAAALPALREWVLETELEQVGWAILSPLGGNIVTLRRTAPVPPRVTASWPKLPVFLRQEQP